MRRKGILKNQAWASISVIVTANLRRFLTAKPPVLMPVQTSKKILIFNPAFVERLFSWEKLVPSLVDQTGRAIRGR